jgi:hypothetical protein
MTKKQANTMNPTITNIPIAISDNPMVIDLPDGQKLVIGKLATGSVIEVATWRGTGRPDSRTSRLMLGMSDLTAVASTDSPQSTEVKAKKKLSFSRGSINLPNIGGILVMVKSIKEMLSSTVGTFKKAIEKGKELEPIETTADLEINAWIENISREVEAKEAKRQASVVKKTSPIKPATKKKR